MKKHFLDEATIIKDSYHLGVQVFDSGFRPTFIVGLWRGGSAIGIYVQECLQTLGVETNHISLRTSYRGMASYQNMINSPENIRVHGTRYLLENLNADDRLLIVDDVCSSGHSIRAVKSRLEKSLKRNYPQEVHTAVLWRRPRFKKNDNRIDYYLHTTEEWLVFPYELKGLTHEEIEKYKPAVAPLIRRS